MRDVLRPFAHRALANADRTATVILAMAAYVPIILTSPGRVSADTKTYLTLDPGKLLSSATSMWDPSVGAGTVPHQNIGYLFPLGPFYWLMDTVGVPDWLTQRLIWGTLVFAAAYGLYRLARWLGWSPMPALVAAFAYGFSPYLLSYLARLSIILAPWAALPWMILLAAKAARTRSWRPAAQFAIVVAVIGSVNATALVLAGLGPVIWLITDVVARRTTVAATAKAAAKIGVLSAAVSLWWVVALRVQGNFGIPILRYTETYDAVSSSSTPAEIVRGLGYWFFYGGDRLDAWVGPSLPYIDNPLIMAVGFTIAGVSLLGLLTRFRGRASAAVLLLIGLAVSVGAAPIGHPTMYGRAFEWFASETTAGLALRSTPRAAPLVLLALALGLGSATRWISDRLTPPLDHRSDVGTDTRTDEPPQIALRPVLRRAIVPTVAIVLVGIQLFPWFSGRALTPSLLRDEQVPGYETDLATWLDSTQDAGSAGRVWEIPASDFANYRWGGTIDPVLPGLIDRPYLARELVPQGGAATADLLNAFERRLPEGWFEPDTLPVIAHLFGVETVVTRNDLEHERYRLARPDLLWTQVTGALGAPDFAGPTVTDQPVIPILDERTLAHPEAAPSFPVVAAFDIGSAPLVTTRAASSPIVLAGSGDGVVDLAGAGLLDPDRPILYAATLADRGSTGDFDPSMVGSDPWWVITDSNRKQGRHWSTVSSNLGAVESTGPIQLDPDPGDNQLDVFLADVGHQTIAQHTADVADVRASYYGNRIAYTPEDAPSFAIDGDPRTAWRAGVFDTTHGLVWEADLKRPATTSTITLLQPITGAVNRYITEVRVTVDGHSVDVALDDTSRTEPGQQIELPADSWSKLRIEVLADNVGRLSDYGTQPGVGLAEVTIPGVTDDRVVDVPGLDAFGLSDPSTIADQRVTYLLTRERIDPATTNRSAAEPRLVRQIEVPDDRTFVLTAQARLSADADDAVLATALGEAPGATADRRLRGSPASRGASAVDGDLSTAWVTPFDDILGATLTLAPLPTETASSPVSSMPVSSMPVSSMTVSWLDDSRHSIPTELSVASLDGIEAVALPPTAPVDGIATATVALDRPMSPTAVTISSIDARTTPEYFSSLPTVLPVAIAELHFGDAPTLAVGSATPLDTTCRTDLMAIDGDPIAVRVDATRADALERSSLRVEACEPVELAEGPHRISATLGATTGFDIDRAVLDSRPDAPPSEPGTPPAAAVEHDAKSNIRLRVDPSESTNWLVLQESWNAGWTARADGVDLGPPVLIDGYANGWLLPPSTTVRSVTLEWTPQHTVRLALWFSLFAGIAILALAVFGRRNVPITDDTVSVAPARRRSIVIAVLLALTVVAVAGPAVAVITALVAVIARRRPLLAGVLTVGVVAGAMAIVGGGIVVFQWRYGFPPGPRWPDRFAWTASFVWLAVCTVVARAVIAEAPCAADESTGQ